MEKILAPLLSNFSEATEATPVRSVAADAFRVVEDGALLSVYDGSGEEIFQIDKEA